MEWAVEQLLPLDKKMLRLSQLVRHRLRTVAADGRWRHPRR